MESVNLLDAAQSPGRTRGRTRDRTMIALSPSRRPILLVVVDTEEEFDWSAGFSRDATSVTAMSEIHRFQRICDDAGVRLTYVVDYPVASQDGAVAPLREYHGSGRAEIGVHLHPWVSPPFDEAVNLRNSFPGNLDPEVEAAKLRALTRTIEEAFETRPTIYKAGRYGIGPYTPDILLKQGFEVDLSAAPPMDYTAEGGPDFSEYPVEPYWFGEGGRLLGLPSTGSYLGFLRGDKHRMYRLAARPALRWLRLPGILARAGMINRLRLSPEGFTLADNMMLTRALLRGGLRVFTFSLHSPSMKPGCTPYVKDESERDLLLDHCRRYFGWFLADLEGVSMTPSELKSHILSEAGRP